MRVIQLNGVEPKLVVVDAPVLTPELELAASRAAAAIFLNQYAFDGPKLLCLRADEQEIDVYESTYSWRIAHNYTQEKGVSGFGLGSAGVWLFLTDEQGRTLWTKRSMNLLIKPGQWEGSCSGGIDIGEGMKEAVLREATEELGVQASDIKDLRPELLCIGSDVGGCTVIFSGFMSCNVPLVLNKKEAIEAAWKHTPEEVGNISSVIVDVWDAMPASSQTSTSTS